MMVAVGLPHVLSSALPVVLADPLQLQGEAVRLHNQGVGRGDDVGVASSWLDKKVQLDGASIIPQGCVPTADCDMAAGNDSGATDIGLATSVSTPAGGVQLGTDRVEHLGQHLC